MLNVVANVTRKMKISLLSTQFHINFYHLTAAGYFKNQGCTRGLLVKIEARPRSWSPRPRSRRSQFKPRGDRDQGLQSSRPRRGRGIPTLRPKPSYCASRPPRDRGVKTKATYHIILRTDAVLKRSGRGLELRLNRSGIFNFIYVMLKCLPTRLRHLLPRPRPRPSESRLRPRPRRSVSRLRQDRGVWNFNLGKTEPRHYCTSRRPRDRGVKTETTSLLKTCLLTPCIHHQRACWAQMLREVWTFWQFKYNCGQHKFHILKFIFKLC